MSEKFDFNKMMAKAYTKRDYIEKELGYSEANAQVFFNMVKKYYEQNGDDVSSSQIAEDFITYFEQLNENVAQLPTIKSETIRFYAVRRLKEDPRLLKEFYDEIIEEEKSNGENEYDLGAAYVANRNVAMKTATLQALTELRENQACFPVEAVKGIKHFLGLPKKVQNQFKKDKSCEEKGYIETLKNYFDGTEFDQLKRYIDTIYPNLEKLLKDKMINSLGYLGKIFEKCGLLDLYVTMQDKNLSGMNLSELGYPLEVSEDPKKAEGQISIKQIFDPKVLSTLDLKKLSMLNAFWINRFTKELNKINISHFVVDSLNLWNQIGQAEPDPKTGMIHIPVDEKELSSLYKKMTFLQIASEKMMDALIKDSDFYGVEEIKLAKEDGGVNYIRKYNTEIVLKEMKQQMGHQYKDEFEKETPDLRHDFKEDLDNFRIVDNSKFNAYKLKDYSMIATLAILYEQENEKEGNWGVILDKDGKTGKGKMMLIGMDIEGLNMPIRLHIEKSLVKDFIKSYQKTTFFPVYEGASDFEYLGRIIPTHIVAPVSKEYKQGLVAATEKQPEASLKKNFLEHLAYISNFRHYPNHLKEDRVERKKGKGKIKRVKPKTKYINLDSGDSQLYVKNNDGEFIPNPQKKDIKEKSEK